MRRLHPFSRAPDPPASMIGFLVRLTALACLAVAFALLVVDGTRSLAGNEMLLTPLGQVAFDLWPEKMKLVQPGIEKNLHPLLWDPILLTLLKMPGWLILGALGTLLFYAGRRRAPDIGFSSRP